MNFIKLAMLLAIAGGGWHYWQKHSLATAAAALEAPSEHGFVAMPLPSGMAARGVVIFAPENCPSEAAQRADALASQLAGKGIPVTRSQSANFTFDADPGRAMLDRINTVMQGEIPIVFVNGKGRANPGVDDVLSEYGRGKDI